MATFLFMPESAYGPTNNCIGIGDVLRRRGHTVVFAAESSWAGRLEPLGFVEDLVDLAPPPAADQPEQAAGQFWTDFIRETKPVFRTSTFDQLAGFMQPTWQALDRRRDVLRATGERDHRSPAPRCDHRGQRGRVSGADDGGCAVRAHRQLPATGDQRPRHPADLQRPALRRPQRVGRVPGRVRPHPPSHVGAVQRVGAVVRRSPARRSGVHPSERAAQHVHLSRNDRLHRSSSARADLAAPRLVGAGD